MGYNFFWITFLPQIFRKKKLRILMVFKFKKVGILFQLKIWELKKIAKTKLLEKKVLKFNNIFFIGNEIFLHKII
jgi:hypothetical protein